jgi:hypothetical protein
MTPKLRESDTHSYKGRITKQGSTIVRWAPLEYAVRDHGGAQIAPAYRRIAERRGNQIARVAAARRLSTLVYVRHEALFDRRGGSTRLWAVAAAY